MGWKSHRKKKALNIGGHEMYFLSEMHSLSSMEIKIRKLLYIKIPYPPVLKRISDSPCSILV
jgi:hypothetical protein